ncbi:MULTISPECIES: lysine N(6)-hydroxylase/L-ornithine N(5)-oxygenase family protein [unclassified Streptomyces]|uniref:lysine N(6)-hydroxylase/L-ornithine N(5)-oxygenase family protein n=1 Tax=unclassified Streptomyces TaxID=2593676 RepID=UPI000CD56084|nr:MULTISPECIES: SidA/IucD/PvdA family monooxygenase [unclassified Streptomyces]
MNRTTHSDHPNRGHHLTRDHTSRDHTTRATEPAAPLPGTDRPLDLAGVGIGPAGLSLAALADGEAGLEAAWYDQRPAFHWHPGLLIEGTTLQVPFLADLVSLVDPTSRWSYLGYLKEQRRLFPFYFAETFHIERTDYDAYCRWASERLPSLRFGQRVRGVRWNAAQRLFDLTVEPTGPDAEGAPARQVRARNLALSTGSAPHLPEHLRQLAGEAGAPVIHSADYLDHREQLLTADHITVVGSGQSGAEVFLDLLRRRPAGAERLHWLTRSPAFAPMEYSKLGLEHFTPDYTRYFHGLPEPTRDALVDRQWQLHKAIDHDTLSAIHGELLSRTQRGGWPDAVLTPGVAVLGAERRPGGTVELRLSHAEQESETTLETHAVVLATGYRDRPLEPLLGELAEAVERDDAGRPLIGADYRLRLDPAVSGAVYVAGGERHTHGVGTPDLGLVAHRSATILNGLFGECRYALPERTAFTTFGLTGPPPPGRRPDPVPKAPGRPPADPLV